MAEGTEITVTMTFANLESDSDTSDTDYIFRADVVGADECENQNNGYGLGVERYMYKVDEDPEVRTGTISADCAPGDYTIEVSISSPGNVELTSSTADFTVAAPAQQQQTEPLSTDATLSGLSLSGITLEFDPATTGYTVEVGNGVVETTVAPTTNHDGAAYVVKLGGVTDADGVLPLAVGANVIAIDVTAEDESTTRTYTANVTRAELPAPRPTATIDLSPSGTVEPGTEITVTLSFANLDFDSDSSDKDYIFRADVKNSNNEDTNECEDQSGGFGLGVDRYMWQVDQDPETRTGSISANCPAGAYMIRASISTPDNVELASATADFTVAAPSQQQQTEPLSTDATLSGLALSGVDFGTFNQATTRYTVSVANDVMQTTVTPTTNGDRAASVVKLGGMADADGVIPLAVGSNVITIEVTAEDGHTTKTYTVTVTRAEPLSTDATLKGLAVSGVDFGKFAPATTSYTDSVANGVDETTVTPTVNDGGATYAIKLDGVVDGDGVIPLAVERNVITIEVTAEDGNTAKTYTVTVTRAAPPLSDDATLRSLALSSVTLAFDPATTRYTGEVGNDIAETTVTAAVNHAVATYVIKLSDVADADGVIPLAVGGNVITIEVTAEDGNAARTYTVTVTRAEAPPEATATVDLSPSGPVTEGTEITVTMTFANLTLDSNANLVFRADVVDADACEGEGIGEDRNMSKVDEDPETRNGTISAACPVGDYTLTVSIWSLDDAVLASASVGFTVVEPEPGPTPEPEPKPDSPSGVPDTPTGLAGRLQRNEATLTWNTVAGADSYELSIKSGEEWITIDPAEFLEKYRLTVEVGNGTATMSTLYDSSYEFRVRAANDIGASEWSEAATVEY